MLYDDLAKTPLPHMTVLWRFEQTSSLSVIWYLSVPQGHTAGACLDVEAVANFSCYSLLLIQNTNNMLNLNSAEKKNNLLNLSRFSVQYTINERFVVRRGFFYL